MQGPSGVEEVGRGIRIVAPTLDDLHPVPIRLFQNTPKSGRAPPLSPETRDGDWASLGFQRRPWVCLVLNLHQGGFRESGKVC